jgi:hypothetical protein
MARVQQLIERLGLPLSKRALPVLREDLGDAQPGSSFDALIQIDEGTPGALRHEAPQRRFAAGHEAIEKQRSLHRRRRERHGKSGRRRKEQKEKENRREPEGGRNAVLARRRGCCTSISSESGR